MSICVRAPSLVLAINKAAGQPQSQELMGYQKAVPLNTALRPITLLKRGFSAAALTQRAVVGGPWWPAGCGSTETPP